MNKYTKRGFFAQFSDEQMRAQYAKNAAGLKEMYDKAIATGKKVNGYTAAQLLDKYNQYLKLANNG